MTIADAAGDDRSAQWRRLDPLGMMIALLAGTGLCLPFAVFKANRIVPGDGLLLWQALPPAASAGLLALLAAAMAVAMLKVSVPIKLLASALILLALALSIGIAATALTPPDSDYARIAIGAGFWLVAFALALMLTDALSRLNPGPWARMGFVLLAAAILVAMFWSGVWNELSILKEYGSRAPGFWHEARTHLLLALGSVALAVAIGVPTGIACYKMPILRAGTLNVLNVIQTIPSIALFGMLIVPLGWVAANVPGAGTIGISGIGTAPALVALVAYALLPIVANTLTGLTGLPEATVEAARGVGMSWSQRLFWVELPLGFPVILAGMRIVLVQNIGLATIAALIGGGGFGVFVFQGIGQTAIDLVLLGAVPTVALAFVAAVLLDGLIELSTGRRPA
ncbi:ABC transporter permease [Devosia sp. YIM 151766]|uniref:ABC transporter permease n=1 Tax=Devosia sp. YIM 151766 TaxID=3017325 RepID=UPI00255CBF78|nr:ABC transporter permease [Devosia sp. YIM 151766]WIY53214.1 ABC transporter permease [Devosia sp. YIM 151766]